MFQILSGQYYTSTHEWFRRSKNGEIVFGVLGTFRPKMTLIAVGQFS